MPTEPSRPLQLLEGAGVALQKRDVVPGAELAMARNMWAYQGPDGLGLMVYEFDGQAALDQGVEALEAKLGQQRRPWDFAQNGEYLLLVIGAGSHPDEERKQIRRVLQAFSGVVER